MKCFLRTNSPEIRNKLEENGITVCVCATFQSAEWLSHSGINKRFQVHGIYPGDNKEEWGTEGVFGNKNNFKDIFLSDHNDYIDCGEDTDLFIETIKESK